MEAVHGVTIEEADIALQRNEWNPVRAQQQLKVRWYLESGSFEVGVLTAACIRLASSGGAAVLAEPLFQG